MAETKKIEGWAEREEFDSYFYDRDETKTFWLYERDERDDTPPSKLKDPVRVTIIREER